MTEADAAAGTMTSATIQPLATAATSTTTKRARRKIVNDTHAWPQHPKLQGQEARARAQIRAAGLNPPTKTASPSDATTTTSSALTLDAGQHSFGRRLGGTDARVRHQTVRALQQHLKKVTHPSNNNARGVTALDLAKLSHALWHTLFLADRPPVQEELCRHICGLVWSVAGGTMEEDVQAGETYLRAMEEYDVAELAGHHRHDDSEHEEENSSEEDEKEDPDDDSEDSDPDVTMEEIVNTLGSDQDEDEDDDESSDSDLEDKQQALLLQDEDDADADSDDDDDDTATNEIAHCRGAHCAALLVRTLYETILRHWSNLDKHRIDKFYTLLRGLAAVSYDYMAQRRWHPGVVRLFNDALYDVVLSQLPNGVRYHMVDVCLEELCKANAGCSSGSSIGGTSLTSSRRVPLTEATFLDVLEPFFAMAQTGFGDRVLQTRVTENVLVKFLTDYSVYAKDNEKEETNRNNAYSEEESSSSSLCLSQVHVGTISQFIFEIAGEETVKDSYRKSLYDVHKQYERRIAELGPDHDVCMDDDDDDNNSYSEETMGESEEDVDDGQPPEKMSDSKAQEEPPPPSKKKKKPKSADKQKGERKNETVSESDKLSKKKGKKKKKKSSMEPMEEEINISVSEQKAAKATMELKEKDKSDSKKKSTESSINTSAKKRKKEENEEADRRVKFGLTNRARSWKASMKGLNTMENPLKKNITPEKSILLNKGAKIVVKKESRSGVKKGKKKRKKS